MIIFYCVHPIPCWIILAAFVTFQTSSTAKHACPGIRLEAKTKDMMSSIGERLGQKPSMQQIRLSVFQRILQNWLHAYTLHRRTKLLCVPISCCCNLPERPS